MGRKREVLKIFSVTIRYNGNRAAFDKFIEAMMIDYLNSDKAQGNVHKSDEDSLVAKVEKSEKTA